MADKKNTAEVEVEATPSVPQTSQRPYDIVGLKIEDTVTIFFQNRHIDLLRLTEAEAKELIEQGVPYLKMKR